MDHQQSITDLVESGDPKPSDMGNRDESSISKVVVKSSNSMVRVLW